MKLKHLAILVLVCLAASCKSNTSSEPKNLPTIISFYAIPDTIEKGETTTLSWSIIDAATASIDQGIGSVGSSGERTVTPTENTTYTLTAGNSDGTVTKTASVTVKEVAVIVLDGTPKKTMTSYDCPMLTGYVRNNGTVTGYNCGIEFRAYSDSNYTTIIDTAHGFPADLGDIGPGQRAYYEAVFFNLKSWDQVKSMDYKITWLNRNSLGQMEPMFNEGPVH
jgi:hypothetical protein